MMSPAAMSFPLGLRSVLVLLSCARDQLMKSHAAAVRGRLNVSVCFTFADAIASRTTQQTKAAHHAHPTFGLSQVAALY
jgi:hypothetical protein